MDYYKDKIRVLQLLLEFHLRAIREHDFEKACITADILSRVNAWQLQF